MHQKDTQALEQYLSRIRLIYHYLFNLAHVVTGSCDAARYCLQYAMLQGWVADEDSAGRHGFREALRRLVLRAALKVDGGEQDWEGLAEGTEDDPLRALIAQEPIELQRILALHSGCRLSHRQIARICDLEASRVAGMLRRFELRMKRKLPASPHQRMDRRIDHAVRAALHQVSPDAPDMGSVFRSFQSEAIAASRPSRLPVRVFQGVVAAVLALLCMATFWFAAVLMQPPVLEQNAQIEETANEN